MTCDKCGTAHVTYAGKPACAGHKKTDDGTRVPCKNHPRQGATVCGYHGGNTPQARAAAQARLAEQEATRQVKTLGLPIDISPTDALLREVQWTAGHVEWLRGKVQELEEQVTHYTAPEGEEDEAQFFSKHPNHARHGLVWGKTKIVDKGSGPAPGTDTTESATPSIWYVLYGQERDRLIAVCSAALRAGVEERKVRLAESQGDLVVTVIRRILDGLLAALLTAGLSDDLLHTAWTTAVADVVPRELRAIAGGA